MAQQPPRARNALHSAESRQREKADLTRKFNEYKLETEFYEDYVVHTTHNWELSTRRWEKSTWKREKIIGTGAFGSVWLHKMQGENGEQGGQLRAVKMLPRTHLRTAYLSQEVLALIKLRDYDHLFVKFLGWYESVENTFLTMEYIEYGDLSKYILQEEKSQMCIKEITRQILEGLEVLHEKDIFHRDLKPQNILIASLDPIWVKITDFGIAKRAKGTVIRTACGTEGYIAPELQGFLPRKFNTRGLLGSALDIWSLGSLLHELLTSQTPFSRPYEDSDSDSDSSSNTDIQLQTDMGLFYDYCNSKIQFPIEDLQNSQVDEEGIAFVKSLLAPNPKERPTASNALLNLWLQGYKSDLFEGLKDEFLRLGVNIDHNGTSVIQAYKADILQFLPKDKVSSLLLEATENGYNLAVSKLLESPSREPIDLIDMWRLFQVATEAKKLNTVKILLSNKSDSDSRVDYGRLMELAVNMEYHEAVGVLLEDTNAITSIDYQKIFLLAIKLGHVDITRMFLDSKVDTYDTMALQVAAGCGHTDIIKLLLGNKAHVDARGSNHQTALQTAAKGGYTDIVKLLLDNNADVNAPAAGYWGLTALQAAVRGGHTDIVKLLLDNNADVNAPAANYGGLTALQAAAGGGHTDIVKLLLDNNADVNAPAAGYGGLTALQAAAIDGHTDIVKLLLDNNADVNTPAVDHRLTALQAAARGGHTDIVKLLLDNNADVNAPVVGYCLTPLQAAAEGGHTDIVKLLLDNNADVNAPVVGYYLTPLQTAAKGGHTDIVKLLLDNNADVNAPAVGYWGLTALQAAAIDGHTDIVKLLLDNNADVNAPAVGYLGLTALQAAVKGGHTDIVKLLLDSKANVNVGMSGIPPLQAAVTSGRTDIGKLLLEHKADLNTSTVDFGGLTIVQLATKGGHIEILKLLSISGADINARPTLFPQRDTALDLRKPLKRKRSLEDANLLTSKRVH